MSRTLRSRWNQLRDWWRRTWINIRPGPEARKGAAWAIIVALLLTILRKLPRLATGFIAGGCIFISLAFGPIGPVFAIVVGLIEITLGATVATFLFGDF